MRLQKIISGGQAGTDQIALRVAKAAGLQTGGTAPKNFMTEEGPRPSLQTDYSMVESESWNYAVRTRQNVADADATLIFERVDSPGPS